MKVRTLSHLGLVSTLALLSIGAITACSGATSRADSQVTDDDGEDVGQLELQLELGDVAVSAVSYVISGQGFTRNGMLEVSNGRTISATIGGIPAGAGYTLGLSGVDAANPEAPCTAAATFDITAHATTTAVVELECLPPSDGGGSGMGGSANDCPRIAALSVEPSEGVVGGSMALSATVTDADQRPMAVTYAWSATGGTVTEGASPRAWFTCTIAGSFDVTLLVSDSVCSDSASATVTCSDSAPTLSTWPGTDELKTIDVASQWAGNLSGLTYEGGASGQPSVLWAVMNAPGTLYRLIDNGTSFVPDPSNDWGAGKVLRYPSGLGNPDAEGVTFGANLDDGIYIAAEHDNDASTISRSAIVRFDVSVAGTSLTATHDFNLTALLPVVGANLGIEAVSWVSDTYLIRKGFFDEAAGHSYVPSEYADHGGGLFLVGLEGGGKIYAFALNHSTGGASLLATISSGQPGVMGLEFDRDLSYLWFSCDDTCGNRSGIFDIDMVIGSPTRGRFVLRRMFDRPATLPDSNNEGIAIGPQSECVGGFKPFFWSDDNDQDGFSLRKDAIPCTSLLP